MPNLNFILIFLAMVVTCYADDMAHKNEAKVDKSQSQIMTPTQGVVNITKQYGPVKTADFQSKKSGSMSMDSIPHMPTLSEKHSVRNMNEQEKQNSGSKDLKVDETIGFGFYSGIAAPMPYTSYYPSYHPYYRSRYQYLPYWHNPYHGSYNGYQPYRFPILG